MKKMEKNILWIGKALSDIPKWDGNWCRNDEYLCVAPPSNQIFWVFGINVKCDVKKNEFFLFKQTDHLSGIKKATGIFGFERVKKYKDKTVRKRQWINRISLKKERPLTQKYENLFHKINESLEPLYRNLPIESRPTMVKYKCVNKSIKTKYGHLVKAYKKDFKLEEGELSHIKIMSQKELKSFGNAHEFKNAQFPLTHVVYNSIDYLFQDIDIKQIFPRRTKEKIKLDAKINHYESKLIKIREIYDIKRRKIKLDMLEKFNIQPRRYE